MPHFEGIGGHHLPFDLDRRETYGQVVEAPRPQAPAVHGR